MKCSDITHQWGYNQYGKWVEQYHSGNLLLLENYPPEGSFTRTPKEQVARENGWCAPDEASTIIVAESAPTQTLPDIKEPDVPSGNTLASLFLVYVLVHGGIFAWRRWNKRSSALSMPAEPVYLNPWVEGADTDDHEESLISMEVRDPHLTRTAPRTAPRTNPAPTPHLYPGADEELTHPIDQYVENSMEGSEMEANYMSPMGISIAEDYVPNLHPSVSKILPFNPMKDPDFFEFDAFKEVIRVAPDLGQVKTILVVWGVKKSGSGKPYAAAKNRYENFILRMKNNGEE